ncbi:MAG: hypothetical protein Q4G43_01745 [Mobilicoccus sp.]|nr:hypothetical protein [Mobilicoccus sp.]
MIVIAVALATTAAAVFAVGTTIQSQAVGRAVTSHSDADDGNAAHRMVGVGAMARLLRNPVWLASVAVIGVGGLLHMGALALAPISIVQPIGVLAIPFAILIAARRRRAVPSGAVLFAVGVTMIAVLGFVLVAASDGHAAELIDAEEIAWSAVGIGAIAAGLALLGSFGPRWLRCLSWASAGAVVYGLASALLRADTMLIAQSGPWSWHVFGYSVAVLVGFVIGGWLVQHAHANGPPAVVLGSLTVIDPIVAVVFGIAFLGEGAQLGPPAYAVMVACGMAAAVGVVLLARHHPDSTPAPPTPSTSTAPAAREERFP